MQTPASTITAQGSRFNHDESGATQGTRPGHSNTALAQGARRPCPALVRIPGFLSGSVVAVRRLLAIFSLASLGVALSAGSALGHTPQNSLTGGGQQAIGGPNFFSLAAHSDASGAHPHGSFSFSGGPPGSAPWHVNVTCLLVSGNDAIATGVADRPAAAAGQIVVAEAVDNGSPHNGQSVDLLRFSFDSNEGIYPGPSPGCFLPDFPPVPIQSGNIVVRQATP